MTRAHQQEKPHHPHWPLACLLFLAVFALGWWSVHEASTWRHVATGQRILAERAVPSVDPFSYTAAGQPWAPDTWLSDVLFFHLDRAGGPAALTVLKAIALAFAFTLLLPVNPSSPLLGATVLLACAATAWRGFTETPAVFDFLLFSLLLRVLRLRRPFSWDMAAQVGLIELLWSNLHASTAVLGLWITALKVFKTGLREGPREWLRHGILLAAALLAYRLNPLGFSALPQLLMAAEDPAWATPAASLWSVVFVLGAASCWVTLQQEFVLTMAVATVLVLSVPLEGLRPLAALASAPVIALAAGHWFRPVKDTPSRLVRWGLAAAALVAAHYAWIYQPLGLAGGYGSGALGGALHYLGSNGVRGRGFNEPETGDALMAAGRPVFCDTRPGVYEPALRRDAESWSSRWRQLDSVYAFDYALLLNRRAGYPARPLDEDPAWALAYADDAALVYLKRSGASGWLTQGTGPRLAPPNRLWPEGLEAALADARRRPRLLDELDRWMVQAPESVQPLLWKAAALDGLKLPQKSERLLELARARGRLSVDPELQAALGFVLERRGQTAEASRAYHRAALLARRARRVQAEIEVLQRLRVLHIAAGDSGQASSVERRLQGLSRPGHTD